MRHKQEVIDQERELTEEQIAIQAILDAKARSQRGHETMLEEEFSMEDTETLPVPSAIFNPGPQHTGGKRTSCKKKCLVLLFSFFTKKTVKFYLNIYNF